MDASAGTHLRFVDAVIALAQANAPSSATWIRFHASVSGADRNAPVALCASVEVSTSRSRLEDILAGFWTEVHALANVSGAVAHWGQEELRQSQNDIALRFGLNLATWSRHWAALPGAARPSAPSSVAFTGWSRAGRRPADAGHVFVAERKYALGLIRDA